MGMNKLSTKVMGSINSMPGKRSKLVGEVAGSLSISEIIASQKSRQTIHQAKVSQAQRMQQEFLTTNVQTAGGMPLSTHTPSSQIQGQTFQEKVVFNDHQQGLADTAESAIAQMKAAEKAEKNMALGMCPDTNPIGFC